jgi:ParB family chromosome partitioning protein
VPKLKTKQKWEDAGAAVANKAAGASVTPIGKTKPTRSASTGPGATLLAMQPDSSAHDEAESNQNIVLLDPDDILNSKFGNRNPASFETAEFDELMASIAAAGGNQQPIKVRPTKDGYEMVFGHRRREACKRQDLKVSAIIDDLSDKDLYIEMDRENRQRTDLSPYEQGLHYKRALDANLFPSVRQLAEALNVDKSQISKAISLAELPKYVVNAFDSIFDLQFRWAKPLRDACKADAKAVKRRAQAISELAQKPAASLVLSKLLKESLPVSPVVVKLGQHGEGKLTNRHGTLSMTIQAGAISKSQEKLLANYASELIDKNKVHAIEGYSDRKTTHDS